MKSDVASPIAVVNTFVIQKKIVISGTFVFSCVTGSATDISGLFAVTKEV